MGHLTCDNCMANTTGRKAGELHEPGILNVKENIIKCSKSAADNTVTFGRASFLISVGHQFVKIRENWGKDLRVGHKSS